MKAEQGDDSDDDNHWHPDLDDPMPDMSRNAGSSSAAGGGSNDANVDEHAAAAALDELTRAAKNGTEGAPEDETEL